MFTGVMVGAILTVLKWVFWITGGLYGLLGLVWAVTGDGRPLQPVIMAGVLLAAGGVCHIFVRKLRAQS